MSLRLAQIFMAVALYFTMSALYHTWGHGLSDDFRGEPIGPHMQFHAIREVFMALGLVIIIAFLMYGPSSVRTRQSWFIMLIASAFMTLGVWASMPISGTALPPGLGPILNHIGNTLCAGIALALCWKSYQN